MPNEFRLPTRRGFLGLIGAGLATAAAPAWALDTNEARALIQKSLDEYSGEPKPGPSGDVQDPGTF